MYLAVDEFEVMNKLLFGLACGVFAPDGTLYLSWGSRLRRLNVMEPCRLSGREVQVVPLFLLNEARLVGRL